MPTAAAKAKQTTPPPKPKTTEAATKPYFSFQPKHQEGAGYLDRKLSDNNLSIPTGHHPSPSLPTPAKAERGTGLPPTRQEWGAPSRPAGMEPGGLSAEWALSRFPG